MITQEEHREEPERQSAVLTYTFEGSVVADTAFPEWFASSTHFDIGDDQPVRETLRGLLGKRVQVTVEVLDDIDQRQPKGDSADAD